MHAIYGLVDPLTGSMRYVGRSNRPTERWQEHCKGKGRTHCAYWVASLRRMGLAPFLTILCWVPAKESGDVERRWIAHYRAMGCDLTNITPGGDGGSAKGHRMSPEANARRIAAAVAATKGKPLSPEHKAKLAAAKLGRKLTQEHKDKIGAKQKGRVKGEQERRNISAAQKGKPRPPESLRKMRESKRQLRSTATGQAFLSAIGRNAGLASAQALRDDPEKLARTVEKRRATREHNLRTRFTVAGGSVADVQS